jgi:penicillin amidase
VRTAARAATAIVAIALVAIALYAGNIALGMRAAAQTTGSIAGLPVLEPVTILRDARGVPHIRARDQHDLYFAEGFVQGQDRLFQLDLMRHYVYGQLAEIFGSAVLGSDEAMRAVPVRRIVAREYAHLSPRERNDLRAFSDGINQAMAREPLPVEFRIFMYRPARWQPEDSLAVAFATVLDLSDLWNAIVAREGHPMPLSDPCYDAPVTQGLAAVRIPPACSPKKRLLSLLRTLQDTRPPIGSNEWATGAAHNTTGRALLANDPHLALGIPGIWYLVDLHAPGFHVAGVTLAGVPGVILGHNDHLAWGATDGTTISMSVFTPPVHLNPADWHTERIHVRFGPDVVKRYYRTPSLFGVPTSTRSTPIFFVRWSEYAKPRSPLRAFRRLARAQSIAAGLRALRSYFGPSQNFELASTSGRVAYQLAGYVPDDPLWGRGVHPAGDLAHHYPMIPFARLPAVAPSRAGIVWTANNRMYGPGYPYRLSAEFAPPYRAYRIAELLRARSRYNVGYFASIQMDTLSIPEYELSRYIPALHGWNGEFDPNSRDATLAFDVRTRLASDTSAIVPLLEGLRQHPQTLHLGIHRKARRWGVAGAVQVEHPLAGFHLTFLNGTRLIGDGDAYTLHMQKVGFSQSFRAVWDVGNWNAGGITLPQGESGEPGSGHYTDEAAAWEAGRLLALPYTRGSVMRASVNRLVLLP